MPSTKMAGFRIWQALWLMLVDWVTGRDREAEEREYFRHLRLKRQEQRRRQWEAQKHKRNEADFQSLCKHVPSDNGRRSHGNSTRRNAK